jgi:two-component system, response regulator
LHLQSETAYPKSPGVILLVEDNPDDQVLTMRALKEVGIREEVIVVSDGAEALEYLFGAGDNVLPILILLDLKLPKVDGLQVLARVKSSPRTRHVPVVVLSSSDEETDVLTGYHLGAESYLRKDVDFVRFVETMRQLWECRPHLRRDDGRSGA